MVKNKKDFEYIRVDRVPFICEGMNSSESNLERAEQKLPSHKELQKEKYKQIMHAKKLVKELIEELTDLNDDFIKSKFIHPAKQVKHRKKTASKTRKSKTHKKSRNPGMGSLHNLAKDLEMIKRQLK